MNKLFEAALSSNTTSVYSTAIKLFKKFLIEHSLCFRSNPQLIPVDEKTLVYFVAYCVERGLRYQTIKIYLAGIRHHYIRENITCPLTDTAHLHQLQYSLTGVKKSQDNTSSKRLPITKNILTDIVHILASKPGIYHRAMLISACTLAFSGFLRCGEFTSASKNNFDSQSNLCVCDVEMSDKHFNLRLKVSKTDIFRQGITIPIYSLNSSICPVRHMKEYLKLRTSSGASPLSPLYLTKEGCILDRTYFIQSVKELLSELNLNPEHYNGHSFRIGAATSAAESGVPDHLIKTLGRWTSDCYVRYIRTDLDSIRRAQEQMSS